MLPLERDEEEEKPFNEDGESRSRAAGCEELIEGSVAHSSRLWITAAVQVTTGALI